MPSFNRTKKAMVLTKSLCSVEEEDKVYGIAWSQQVSGKGEVLGTGSFLRREYKGHGSWSGTLKKRMTMRKKEKEGTIKNEH